MTFDERALRQPEQGWSGGSSQHGRRCRRAAAPRRTTLAPAPSAACLHRCRSLFVLVSAVVDYNPNDSEPQSRMTDDLFGSPPPPRKIPPAKGKPAPRAGTPGEGEYNASSIEVLEGLEPVRRRPGMYIGGTDANALHHLFAEVIDNAMDEAVAGHATFIEVVMEEGGWLAVTDNGRGMPVDPHPKFPGKSALEIIMTKLHAGGKFDSGAYETSGGLHGVGVSVVNALSARTEVEVARGADALSPVLRARRAREQAGNRRQGAQPARHQSALPARSADFRRRREIRSGAGLQDDARQGLSVRRRRNPLALRAGPARRARQNAARGGVSLPRRPQGLSRRRHRGPGHGRRSAVYRQGGEAGQTRLGRMGGRLARRRGWVRPFLLQHDPDAGRRHARGGPAHCAAARG